MNSGNSLITGSFEFATGVGVGYGNGETFDSNEGYGSDDGYRGLGNLGKGDRQQLNDVSCVHPQF